MRATSDARGWRRAVGGTMRHVLVIGAGAAGMMAAIFAARSGARVTLLERTKDGGRKILISGGGRCNVLPSRVDEGRFVTDSSPNVLRRILRSWPLASQIEFFEQDLGIPLEHEEESLKLFPASHKARDVRDGLLDCCQRDGVQLVTETGVTDIAPDGARWLVSCDDGRTFDADAVVVATGGLSVPNTGSDGRGLAILRRLGHTLHTTYAALTPITVEPCEFTELAGISLPVTLSAKSGTETAKATGGFLFTHRGYSGPSVLNVSHVAVRARVSNAPRATIAVRWTPHGEEDWNARLQPHGARTVSGAVRAELPERLAAVLIRRANVDPLRPLTELRREERLRLVDVLVRGELPWAADEGYKKAEVTGGGVSLAEIDHRTMQSRRHPGLYLCGEVLDAFGPIGGYNFLWAWTTGRAAGQGAASGG
ncbi:MAG TPA: aminoacetone oxidase family FAD-binding enzyme [Gemmatimonadaceae bacterium]|nr:aminoacetone oxidase family FAD-binding enzyme [Gemmatimonadaceae bacterium]